MFSNFGQNHTNFGLLSEGFEDNLFDIWVDVFCQWMKDHTFIIDDEPNKVIHNS